MEASNEQTFQQGIIEGCGKRTQDSGVYDAWGVVDRPDGVNIIHSIWAFRMKCYPDGMPKQFNAPFCAQGDQQFEGIDFLKHTHQWFTGQQ